MKRERTEPHFDAVIYFATHAVWFPTHAVWFPTHPFPAMKMKANNDERDARIEALRQQGHPVPLIARYLRMSVPACYAASRRWRSNMRQKRLEDA